MNGWTSTVYLYKGILFSHEKEWCTGACCNIMLSKRSQDTKATYYYMNPFTWNVQDRQVHRDRKQRSGCQELAGPGMCSDCCRGAVSLWGGDVFGNQIVMMFAHVNVLNATEFYSLKWLIVLCVSPQCKKSRKGERKLPIAEILLCIKLCFEVKYYSFKFTNQVCESWSPF